MTSQPPPDIWESTKTNTGETLGELSRKAPVLIVFLRHCGCTFAREALADVAAQKPAITATGTDIVVVHMQSDDEARELFARYGLADVLRISDPQQSLYRAFEVVRGNLWQVAGPGMWLRAVASLIKGNMIGVPNADVFQLPGAFLIRNGQIVNAFRGKHSSDRPDYANLAQCSVR